MTYFVEQFGDLFFSLIKVKGYTKNSFFSRTEITAEEYKKLYYSDPNRKTLRSSVTGITEYRCKGNWKDILRKELILCV